MNPIIYIIADKASGNCYVGSTINPSVRWKRHLYELKKGTHHSYKLQICFNKVGENGIAFSIVQKTDKNDMDAAEQNWITKLDSVKNGMNVCPIAYNPGSFPKSEEHKAKIGKAHKGRKNTEEAKERMSLAAKTRKQRTMTEEQKAAWKLKISNAKKGRRMSEEAKAKLSKSKTGKKTGPMSDAQKEAIRQSKIGKPLSAYQKQRISQGLRAKHGSC